MLENLAIAGIIAIFCYQVGYEVGAADMLHYLQEKLKEYKDNE